MKSAQFWFPFDYYTVVGHVGKIQIFYIEGQVAELKRTVLTHWNTPESDLTADLDATTTIHFSRPWCLWVLGFIVLGGGVFLGVSASLLYRGFPQYITVTAFLLALLALRASIFKHISAPTLYDVVVGTAFLISIVLFFIPSHHHRVRTY